MYTWLGVTHILGGFDHLLFVLCLIYISRTRKKLLWTITGFTIAHSLTLVMTTLGWVQVPIPPVEASIALSIVFLALEILKNKGGSLTLKYPVLVSSTFGLLHGFGFASVLEEIGLPENELGTALFTFNVGVELGQLLFVISLVLLKIILEKIVPVWTMDSYRRPIGYFCGIVSMFWLIERIYIF